jgi:hypothetical protein
MAVVNMLRTSSGYKSPWLRSTGSHSALVSINEALLEKKVVAPV